MKAWHFTTTHEPLVRMEIPDPVAGPGQAVVDIAAAGLCHSDVGALTDETWLPYIPNRPLVIGHEIAGIVSSVGEGVTEVAVGDRVGVCPSNGHGAPGYARDGGFAERHLCLAEDLVPMPEALAFDLAAIGTDAGMTSYHAMVTRGEAAAGMKVGVIGLGGLGQIGARVAVVRGCEVHVAEVNDAVWPLARELGAASVVADVLEWEGQDFDLIVDYAGYGTTTAHALKAIRKQGRVVVVGMARMQIPLETMDVIHKQAEIRGSSGGTKADVAAIYDLLAAGEVRPVVRHIGFEDIPAGLDDLQHHRVAGRTVAIISGS
jgi:propanol-preferring alcohol dehydrogenase